METLRNLLNYVYLAQKTCAHNTVIFICPFITVLAVPLNGHAYFHELLNLFLNITLLFVFSPVNELNKSGMPRNNHRITLPLKQIWNIRRKHA